MDGWLQECLDEESRVVSGWDFSYLAGRMESSELPWDYRAIVMDSLRRDDDLLDMGTGGGEFLSTLNHPPERTCVTEAYAPNLALCRERLSPLGIGVYCADSTLPFSDHCFDRIINRHAGFDAEEVFRVLKPGGMFITQQVGGLNNRSLSERLIEGFRPSYPNHDLAHNVEILQSAGFRILRAEEAMLPERFYDAAALVYYAKAIPWEFPGFTVNGCLDRLKEIQDEIDRNGWVETMQHRFLIAAQKDGDIETSAKND